MKFIVLVVFCIFAAQVKAGLKKQEIVEALRTIAAGCIEETGASENDVDIMVKHLPAQNKETKCLRACVMKKVNVMNDNGKFVKDVALKMADLHTNGDAEKMQIAKDVANACSDIAVSDNHCEAAETYKMCMTSEAKKHGINIANE